MAMARERSSISQIVDTATSLGFSATIETAGGGFSVFGWRERGRKGPDLILRLGVKNCHCNP